MGKTTVGGGSAVPFMEMAHGSGVDVPNEVVAVNTHKVKGCLSDNLSTAYAVKKEDTVLSASETLLKV